MPCYGCSYHWGALPSRCGGPKSARSGVRRRLESLERDLEGVGEDRACDGLSWTDICAGTSREVPGCSSPGPESIGSIGAGSAPSPCAKPSPPRPVHV